MGILPSWEVGSAGMPLSLWTSPGCLMKGVHHTILLFLFFWQLCKFLTPSFLTRRDRSTPVSFYLILLLYFSRSRQFLRSLPFSLRLDRCSGESPTPAATARPRRGAVDRPRVTRRPCPDRLRQATAASTSAATVGPQRGGGADLRFRLSVIGHPLQSPLSVHSGAPCSIRGVSQVKQGHSSPLCWSHCSLLYFPPLICTAV